MKHVFRALLLAVLFFPVTSSASLTLDQGLVHFIYLSPSDVPHKEHYERAILSTVFDLQIWYAAQLDDASFSVSQSRSVSWYQLPNDSDYYRANPHNSWFWESVLADSDSFLHSSYADPNDIWIILVDVDLTSSQIFGGQTSRVVLPAPYIRGLAGEPILPLPPGETDGFGAEITNQYEWRGELAFQLGLAFGLEQDSSTFLMGNGYKDYPETSLLGTRKAQLLTHSMIGVPYETPQSNMVYSSLKNGGFEAALTPWIYYTNGDGGASVNEPGYVSPRGFKVAIDNVVGTNVQLLQRNIELEPKTDYVFAFTGYSASGNDVGIALFNNSAPYKSYGMHKNSDRFDLVPAWKQYIHRFTTKGFTSPVTDGKLYVWFADDAETFDRYCFDDFSLAPVARGDSETIDHPLAPSSAEATLISETTVRLTWAKAHTGYTNLANIGYFVYRDGEYVAAVTTNCCYDDDLEPGDHYVYEIRTINCYGLESVDAAQVAVEVPLPENLIMNGGFEENGLYWGLSWDKVVDAEFPFFGEKSASICLRGTGGELLLYQGGIPLMANTGYQLSFYARSSMGDDITVVLHEGLDAVPVDLDTEWQLFEFLFRTPDNGDSLESGYVLFSVGSNPRPWQCYEFDLIALTTIDTSGGEPLAPPTMLRSSMGSETVVCLSWDAPVNNPGGLTYSLYRNDELIATTSDTMYIEYGLALGQLYDYTVVATDPLGRSSVVSNTNQVETPATLLEGVNLVVNGGFEDGMFPWKSEDLRAYASELDPMEGIRCGRMHFPIAHKKAEFWQSNILLERETKYNLSFFARSNRLKNDEIILDVMAPGGSFLGDDYDPYSYGLEEYAIDVSPDWKMYFIKFETPSTFWPGERTTLSFSFKDWSGLLGAYSLDQISLVKEGEIESLVTGQSDGTVVYEQKISQTHGGFGGVLKPIDLFGFAVDDLGDVNGDGVTDLAVGTFDDDGGFNTGAVWILLMNADGTVWTEQKISDTQGEFMGDLNTNALFGAALSGIGDLNGDGVPDLAVGNYGDDDGGMDRGAVWILFLNSDGTVSSYQKISQTQGGFTGTLSNSDQFGSAVADMGDLDGDGVMDIAVGSWHDDDGGPDTGAVWILFLNTNGTVKGYQKISDLSGGFSGVLDDGDIFGTSVARLDDLDGDGVDELVVGALFDDDGGIDFGALWILYLNPDGTVERHSKISATLGGFVGPLTGVHAFGFDIDGVPDLNGDGVPEIVVGARGYPDGGPGRGAIWTLFLNPDGTVASEQKVSDTSGGFNGVLADDDLFGTSVSTVADLNGDGDIEYAVGASSADDGGDAKGALWILFLK